MGNLVAASAPHAAAMAAIHAACFPPGARWDERAIATLVAQPGAFALIDPEGGFVLARVASDEAEILTLAVTPEQRRRGRARALLRAAMRQGAAAGARTLFLEVAQDNVAAVALYETEGFRPVGVRRAYYAGCRDALVLRRALDEPPAGGQVALP